MAAMDISLRDFLGGHVLRKAMLHFEDAIGPWVKDEVREHFNRKLAIPPDEDDRLAAEYEAACEARDAERVRLVARQNELQVAIRSCPKEERQAVAQQKKAIEDELKQLDSTPAPPPPVPRWIGECRQFFGPAMKHHVNASNRWDVHMIVVVMRALLRDVFEQHLPDHFHAKELLSGILRVLSMHSTRAHRIAMAEFDVLGAMQQMVSVMQQCRRDADAVTAVSKLLDESKDLVQAAREEGDAQREGPTLPADEATAQRLYTALTAWELHVEAAMGLVSVVEGGAVVTVAGQGRLAYKDDTVVFGDGLDARWTAAVHSLKPHLTVVATARHWYFHNLQGSCDFVSTFAAMHIASSAITTDDAASPALPWHPPPVAVDAVQTTLHLHTPSVRMSIPVARVDEIVGREATVKRVTAALTTGARVLIHGLPGVGKDTVMAEVAHQPEIQSLGGLKAWLQASSDVVLRRQLIELFATHQPRVVAGVENDATEAIAAIKRWLAANSDWVLFVEDASQSSTTLWDVLSSAGVGGRVLVTSQEAGIALKHTMFKPDSVFELQPITTDESIELLIKSNVLARKAPSPLDGESENELKQRCVAAGAADIYIAPPEGEKAKDQKQRRKRIEASLFERIELGRPEMRSFLKDTLGNLPLTVAQVGHMLRADAGLRGVLDLIELFRPTADPADFDSAGDNPMQVRHYYGLSLSLCITLDRLRSADGVPEEDREGALALLSMLSLLDRAQTPVSLLCGHDEASVMQQMTEACSEAERDDTDASSLESRQKCTVSTSRILSDITSLERARDLCIRYGLLRDTGESGDDIVGVMHQLVQRCVRAEMVIKNPARSGVVGATRGVLKTRFTYNSTTPPSQWPAMLRLAPCIRAWVGHVCGDFDHVSTGEGASEPVVSAVAVDCDILQGWGRMLSKDGHAATAKLVCERTLDLRQLILPEDHTGIALSMSELAGTYCDLGQYEDALRIEEVALELRRKVLPLDFRAIGQSTHNVAVYCSRLGRREEALKLKIESLKFARRTLPPNDPEIATAMHQLAQEYYLSGCLEKARDLEREVVEFRQRVLEPDDPATAKAMNSLAFTLSDLGHHEEALEMQKAALKINERVQRKDHPEIAEMKVGIARTLLALGKYKKAARIQTEALEIQQRVLIPCHGHIIDSMNNLAVIYGAMGRHDDAVVLTRQVLEADQQRLRPDHPDIGLSMGNHGAALGSAGKAHESVTKLEEAVAHLELCSKNNRDKAKYVKLLGVAYVRVKRYDDARDTFSKALRIQGALKPPDHEQIAVTWGQLAVIYFKQEDIHGAEKLFRIAIQELSKAQMAQEHPTFVAMRRNLRDMQALVATMRI